SIAAGLVTSLPRERGYPALVDNLMPSTQLVNLAVPGETTASFMHGQLQRFQQELAQLTASGAELRAVTITLGGNDVLALQSQSTAERQAGLDQFKTSYPQALAAIRAALGDLKPAVVVTTYYDLSEGNPNQQGSDAWWLHQFNEVIRAAAQAQGMRVADLEPAFRGQISRWTWYPNDIHPNNAGHAAIARLVWTALGLDTQAPSIAVQSPAAGTLGRRTPTVRVVASDTVGVTDVSLWVDGKAIESLLYVPSQQAYIGVWDARDYAQPRAMLTVKARDLAGNEATAEVNVALPGS
ncbi:MAG TPA: GDSL-type esterase/lipase family protein, partial [Thermomicrobiaceae bacterium]|nr:GDSL-type esterase/lipase family protein [Thermomicrobiaceae bacterium]